MSIAPFLQSDLPDGGFAYVRFLVNLDEPAGVFSPYSSSLTDVWSVVFGGGLRF